MIDIAQNLVLRYQQNLVKDLSKFKLAEFNLQARISEYLKMGVGEPAFPLTPLGK